MDMMEMLNESLRYTCFHPFIGILYHKKYLLSSDNHLSKYVIVTGPTTPLAVMPTDFWKLTQALLLAGP